MAAMRQTSKRSVRLAGALFDQVEGHLESTIYATRTRTADFHVTTNWHTADKNWTVTEIDLFGSTRSVEFADLPLVQRTRIFHRAFFCCCSFIIYLACFCGYLGRETMLLCFFHIPVSLSSPA